MGKSPVAMTEPGADSVGSMGSNYIRNTVSANVAGGQTSWEADGQKPYFLEASAAGPEQNSIPRKRLATARSNLPSPLKSAVAMGPPVCGRER